jgi:hypothetical protein
LVIFAKNLYDLHWWILIRACMINFCACIQPSRDKNLWQIVYIMNST